MLGFVLGALCVVAAAKVMRRGWMWHSMGRHCSPFGGRRFAGYGPGACGGFGAGGEFGGFDEVRGYREGGRGPWSDFGAGHEASGRRGRGWGREGFGFGADARRRWFLRGLFERLETTPGQEKAILAAFDRLRDERRQVFDEARESRAAVARVIESGLVDDAALEETFARHDRVLARVRVSFVEAMKTVTEALDERQRKELASLIGGAGGGFFGSRF